MSPISSESFSGEHATGACAAPCLALTDDERDFLPSGLEGIRNFQPAAAHFATSIADGAVSTKRWMLELKSVLTAVFPRTEPSASGSGADVSLGRIGCMVRGCGSGNAAWKRASKCLSQRDRREQDLAMDNISGFRQSLRTGTIVRVTVSVQ